LTKNGTSTTETQRHRGTEKGLNSTSELKELTGQIIGAAIEVHKALGPGLLESVYEKCLCLELELRGLKFERQLALPLEYKGVRLDVGLKLDFVVEGKVVVEIKAVEKPLPVHEAQLLTYLRMGGYRVGLLLNFNTSVLKEGITRMIL
jgi:GxxExxY protein